LSTCARQEAENHGIVDLSALDDIEVDIRVLLAVHECTMERRSAPAREEPLALGDIRDIADQERPPDASNSTAASTNSKTLASTKTI
jgi:hypothetical protein